MTKKELLQKLASQNELKLTQVESVYDDLVALIIDELKTNNEISLSGLGSLKRVLVAERTGRNPKTGEALTIQAHYKTKYTPSKSVKIAINS